MQKIFTIAMQPFHPAFPLSPSPNIIIRVGCSSLLVFPSERRSEKSQLVGRLLAEKETRDRYSSSSSKNISPSPALHQNVGRWCARWYSGCFGFFRTSCYDCKEREREGLCTHCCRISISKICSSGCAKRDERDTMLAGRYRGLNECRSHGPIMIHGLQTFARGPDGRSKQKVLRCVLWFHRPQLAEAQDTRRTLDNRYP